MNMFFFYTSILLTSFLCSLFTAYFGFIHSTSMLHKSFAACAYASFIVFLLLIVISESLRFGRFEPSFFSIWLCVGAVFSSHLFLYKIVDNFWSSNHDFKAVKKNTLKSMANHFVWNLFYFCAWTIIPPSRFSSPLCVLFPLL